MTYEKVTEKFPDDIREFLDTTLAERGLPRNDPVVTLALIQIEILEVIEKRRRRNIYSYALAAVVVCSMVSGIIGYEFAKARQAISLTHAAQIETVKAAKDAWVTKGKVFVVFQ